VTSAEKTPEPERDLEQMEEQSERLGEHIEETRDDWEQKEQDSSVPGAQPEGDE
jgi:hypothetical protein